MRGMKTVGTKDKRWSMNGWLDEWMDGGMDAERLSFEGTTRGQCGAVFQGAMFHQTGLQAEFLDLFLYKNSFMMEGS